MDLAAALIAVRFALCLNLMLVFGLPLFSLYTRPGGGQRGSEVISSTTLSTLLLSGAALSVLGLVLLAAAMSDVAVAQLDRETMFGLLNETAIGAAGKVRVAALLVALPVSFWPDRYPRSRRVIQSCLGGAALGSLAWTGHGAAGEGLLGKTHLTADIVHLLAAGVWVGALAGLLILILRARAEGYDRQERTAVAYRALAGFATVGTLSVGLIIVSGFVNGWFLVGPEDVWSLTSSLYGRLLLLKLLVFAGMISLAALNRFRLIPATKVSLSGATTAKAMRSIRQSVALEAALALTVLGLVAWLGTLAPPTSG